MSPRGNLKESLVKAVGLCTLGNSKSKKPVLKRIFVDAFKWPYTGHENKHGKKSQVNETVAI